MTHKHRSFIHHSVNIYWILSICQTKSLASYNLLPPVVFYSYRSPLFKLMMCHPTIVTTFCLSASSPTLIYPADLHELWSIHSPAQNILWFPNIYWIKKLYSRIQKMFIVYLLCARLCSKCWGYSREADKNVCSRGTDSLVEETDNKQDK